MQWTYDSLYLASLDPKQHEQTCNYWFCVHTSSFAHTAFTTIGGLHKWMQERGLQLEGDDPVQGVSSWQPITGTYRQQMHRSYDEFFALEGERTRDMSNGDYTLAIITDDPDGIKTVHTLNPNCLDRPVFDYAESREMMR